MSMLFKKKSCQSWVTRRPANPVNVGGEYQIRTDLLSSLAASEVATPSSPIPLNFWGGIRVTIPCLLCHKEEFYSSFESSITCLTYPNILHSRSGPYLSLFIISRSSLKINTKLTQIVESRSRCM